MKRKWIRRVSWILLTPVLLFVILMILLYIPPVQNLLRREVTAYASKATGMQIQVERIDLRFPLNLLVRGVEVIQQPDTLLSLESLNVRVQAWPLVKGKVEVDEVTLSQVAFNSANLIEGMKIKGYWDVSFYKVMELIFLMSWPLSTRRNYRTLTYKC